MKSALIASFFLFLFLLLGIGFFLHGSLRRYAETPTDPKGQEMLFAVERGEGFRSIVERLEEKGLIQKPLFFRLFARLQKDDTRIRFGEYAMSSALSPKTLLQMMVEGKVKRYRLTLPEGLRITEIAKRVAKIGLVTEEAFLALALDAEFSKTLGIPEKNLEGYLFPDTYFFTKKDTADTMIRTMVQHFNAVFDEEKKQRALDINLSLHAVVTLASLVEKETGKADERPLIAAVFHNRLAQGIRLETDPTVVYGTTNFKGKITRSQLRTWTPYNTYRIPGLPPGPIASPGEAALDAVLWPADTKYLFFVSKNDGSHHFSRTYPEHNRAVQKYQRRKKTTGK